VESIVGGVEQDEVAYWGHLPMEYPFPRWEQERHHSLPPRWLRGKSPIGLNLTNDGRGSKVARGGSARIRT